jgi:site-specific recombinase XerD
MLIVAYRCHHIAKRNVQATPIGEKNTRQRAFLCYSSKIANNMIQNEISKKTLGLDAQKWILQLQQALQIQDKGKGTIKSYVNEMVLFFKYHNDKAVLDITQADIERYIMYIKTVHKVGRAKCRSMASACAYFYKHVLKQPYILPSTLYPQKQFILPNIMSQVEVAHLLASPLTLKEYCVIGLLYGGGLRISEVATLCIKDIDSQSKRIKIVQGKGAKDRFTLLPVFLLPQLRAYYVASNKPAQYFFTSKQTGKAFHTRSLQLVVNSAMAKAGFANKPFTAHTLRHSFATHMLDNGSNIHVIKTLLGHSKIETTMVYLHLQQHTQYGIVSPMDKLLGGADASSQ